MTQPTKPKYVFMSPWAVRAGAGSNNVLLGIAGAMQHRYEPAIVITGWDPPSADQIWLKMPCPPVSARSFIGFGARLLPLLIRLRKTLRGAVAVNPHYIGLEFLPLALLRKLGLSPKLILSVHGSDVAEMLQTSGLSRKLYRLLLSSADLVVACSKALADDVHRVSPRARVVSIWNAPLRPTRVAEERPLQPPYVVCVARFSEIKGQDVLLRAFLRVSNEKPDLKLVLIGAEGPERVPLIRMAADMGLDQQVEIRVNLPHELVWQWVRHAECLVLPSRREGFPICLLEAGMLRTPVVATRVGGIPELLDDEIHGLLCQPDQPDCLANAILRILSDPATAKSRADALYERVSELTWDRAFESYRQQAALP